MTAAIWTERLTEYDRTTVVAPGGRFDVSASAALFVAAAVIGAFSAAGFRVRDVGAPLLGRRRARHRSVRTPSANPLLRVPVLSALWEQRLGLPAWLLGSAVLAAQRVVAERGLTLAAASVLIAAAGTVVVAGLVPSQGIHLRADRRLLATALLVPLALSFGALGAAITARLPRLALPVLAAIRVREVGR